MNAEIPHISARDVPLRQLWVGGRRAARVGTSGAQLGLVATANGYLATAPVDERWAEDEVEMRWPSQIQKWIEPRCVVSSVQGANISVAPECWSRLIQRNGGSLPPSPLRLENVRMAPLAGEFYSSRDTVYFRPWSEEPYRSPEDAWVGLVNHSFTGLNFMHASWRVPADDGGFVPTQSLVMDHEEPAGAVRFSHSTWLAVQRCSFSHVGAAYALSIGGASQHIVVSESSFLDLSGGAIMIGNVNEVRALTRDADKFDVGYLLRDNVMRGVAVEFRGAAAIFAGYVARTNILHNTIIDTGYTGISLGWGWGKHVNGPQTFAADNVVAYNRLIGVMSALNDGGCIYTLGPQPRSKVEGNYCSADRASVVGCFYHDNGSRYFSTQFNVAESSPAPCVYLQGCCGAPAYDVAVSHLWCRSTGDRDLDGHHKPKQ
ncbi:MAG: hypothetical protein SGPRY_003982 [Prymnesium sp.]